MGVRWIADGFSGLGEEERRGAEMTIRMLMHNF